MNTMMKVIVSDGQERKIFLRQYRDYRAHGIKRWRSARAALFIAKQIMAGNY